MARNKATLLRSRIPLLQERVELLESFLSLGLKKVDVSRACGLSLQNVSLFFSGRNDSEVIEDAIKEMITEAKSGGHNEAHQVSA